MRFVRKLISKLAKRYAQRSSESYVAWLRRKGVVIGEGVVFHQRANVSIDLTRPTLIEIGNNVHFTYGLVILTHGYDWVVLRNIYNEVISSSGKVTIKDNVFIGYNVTILKGVTVGNNCIIGAGSVVTKDVPDNSVAAGNPANIICTIEDYYRKRKDVYVDEAKQYAQSIKRHYRRDPVPNDFWEEFPLFLDGSEQHDGIPIKMQLGDSYNEYAKNHKAQYPNFESFLDDCEL